VDLLKVGHHGSRGATGSDWLAELAPRAAVISVGANRYGHPHAATLRRLEEARVPVWRTDQDGTVRVWTDGVTVEVRGRGRRMEYVIQE
jgi:competence protein ComEC